MDHVRRDAQIEIFSSTTLETALSCTPSRRRAQVGLGNFFIGSSERPTLAVVKTKDRLRLPDRPGEESPSYFFEILDFPVTDRKKEAYYAEFKAHAKPMEPVLSENSIRPGFAS
jgi:hypothetical protein